MLASSAFYPLISKRCQVPPDWPHLVRSPGPGAPHGPCRLVLHPHRVTTCATWKQAWDNTQISAKYFYKCLPNCCQMFAKFLASHTTLKLQLDGRPRYAQCIESIVSCCQPDSYLFQQHFFEPKIPKSFGDEIPLNKMPFFWYQYCLKQSGDISRGL